MWERIKSIVTTVLGWMRPMWRSIVAAIVVAVLGLFSMGILGAGLYYPAAPVLLLKYPSFNSWHGDWVWPTVILAGMAFSVGFLIAGRLNLFLESRQSSKAVRVLTYIAILWAWNLCVWFMLLSGQFRG